MSSKREKLLQKVNPKLLQMTPKLSGVSGSVIDLDLKENSLEDGARNLMMRFFKNHDLTDRNKKIAEDNKVQVTVSSVKYNEKDELCELVSERLSFPIMEDPSELDLEIPGRKLQKLRSELQEKISAKWEEEYKKRVNESKHLKSQEDKEDFEEEANLSDDEIEGEDENEDEDEDEAVEEDELDNDLHSNADSEKEEEADDEAEDDGFEEEENDSVKSQDETEIKDQVLNADDSETETDIDNNKSGILNETDSIKIGNCDEAQNSFANVPNNNCNNEDDYGECSLIPAYQPGGGLLYGGSELTQYKEDLPQSLLSPSLKFSMSQSQTEDPVLRNLEESNTKMVENNDDSVAILKKNLFQNSQTANNSFDLTDAFDLCSGVFPEENKSQIATLNQTSTELSSQKITATGTMELTINDEIHDIEGLKNLKKKRKNIIEPESSDAEENFASENEDDEAFVKNLLSDNEETPGEYRNFKKKNRKNLHFSDDDEDDDQEKTTGKQDNDDDSSDNEEDAEEKSVNYDSEENEIINAKDFLEGEAELSGSEFSGDEDEQGLDVLDQEDGDADELDNDQIRSQLEKIHMRTVLDDDIRQVRYFQELLLEDGDLHGDGKRRERKFNWNNLGGFENSDEIKENEPGNSSEDDCAEDEETLKLRHQKEMFLMEKKNSNGNSSDEENLQDFTTLKVTSLKESVKVIAGGQNKMESIKTIVDVTEMRKPFTLNKGRGSFLTRNEDFLSRLARVTSAATDNVLGPKNSKNFVFAPKSPEKTNPETKTVCKRQVEESDFNVRQEKKMKLFPKEIVAGPSILDLLV